MRIHLQVFPILLKPMSSKVFYKTNFYFDFYERKELPNIYSSISYKGNSFSIRTNPANNLQLEDLETLVLEYFPSYLNFSIHEQYKFKQQNIFKVKGYCIAIQESENVETYLGRNFKPNFRTSIRRRLSGLERCFDIRYKMIYGSVLRDEYDFIMNELETMLIRRFAQRNDENMALRRWKDYYNNTYKLINQKKASLYVIYDDVKPIQISLCYHYNSILFLSIPSYNIDYSKFGLGNISVLKLLEWCIANNYKTLDMGFGAFDYKVKWCNDSYNFEHHVFYTKSSIRSRLLLFSISLKTKVINYLISKKLNIYYRKFKSAILPRKKLELPKFKIENVNNKLELLSNCTSIDALNDNEYMFLRWPLNDFAYTQLEHVSQIRVYELVSKKIYFFQSAKQISRVTFEYE